MAIEMAAELYYYNYSDSYGYLQDHLSYLSLPVNCYNASDLPCEWAYCADLSDIRDCCKFSAS